MSVGRISGVYEMSQKKITQIKDSFELITLVSIFLFSVIAITPIN